MSARRSLLAIAVVLMTACACLQEVVAAASASAPTPTPATSPTTSAPTTTTTTTTPPDPRWNMPPNKHDLVTGYLKAMQYLTGSNKRKNEVDVRALVKLFNAAIAKDKTIATSKENASFLKDLWCSSAITGAKDSCTTTALVSSLSNTTGSLYGTDALGVFDAKITKYNYADPRWADALLVSLANMHDKVFRPAPNTSSYTYPLVPAGGAGGGGGGEITIALLGDWGTGQPQAINMLQQIVGMNPDIVLHLGDVYYAGTTDQQNAGQFNPAKNLLKPGMQWYTIPGNHDYYSSNKPFLDIVDLLRGEGLTKQESSFFALEGDNWVLVNVDTGYYDSDYINVDHSTTPTHLGDNQRDWANAQVARAKAAGKRVIFTSHHQLMSPVQSLGTSSDGTLLSVNPLLYSELNASIPLMDAWFWGHEHSIQAFQPYAGLQRGRLLGNSAIPKLYDQQPYTPNPKLQPFPGEAGLPQSVPGSPMSAMCSYGYYLQHSFALLKLKGTTATVEYYQIDWDCKIGQHPGCTWYPATLMWSETF